MWDERVPKCSTMANIRRETLPKVFVSKLLHWQPSNQRSTFKGPHIDLALLDARRHAAIEGEGEVIFIEDRPSRRIDIKGIRTDDKAELDLV